MNVTVLRHTSTERASDWRLPSCPGMGNPLFDLLPVIPLGLEQPDSAVRHAVQLIQALSSGA
jgi:hypothetical protein